MIWRSYVTNNPVIKFSSFGYQVPEIQANPPYPAKKHIPEYWKKIPRYHGKDDEKKVKEKTAVRGNLFLGLKHCMPYFDSMSAGWHFPLHTDVYVLRDSSGLPQVSWNHNQHPVAPRSTVEMPTPHGHYNMHFSWQMYWGIETPPGWQLLLSHPINHYDLPFTTHAGLMDTDVYPLPGNVSFHIKDNFEGVIRAGTPIMSLLPIKREVWESTIDTDPESWKEKQDLVAEKNQVVMGHYKDSYHIGVDYN